MAPKRGPAERSVRFNDERRLPMAKDKRLGTKDEILCSVCKTRTKHTIRGTYKTHFDNDDISGGGTHDLLSCDGCNSVTYKVVSWCSEDAPEDTGVSLFPPRSEKMSSARMPRDFIE